MAIPNGKSQPSKTHFPLLAELEDKEIHFLSQHMRLLNRFGKRESFLFAFVLVWPSFLLAYVIGLPGFGTIEMILGGHLAASLGRRFAEYLLVVGLLLNVLMAASGIEGNDAIRPEPSWRRGLCLIHPIFYFTFSIFLVIASINGGWWLHLIAGLEAAAGGIAIWHRTQATKVRDRLEARLGGEKLNQILSEIRELVKFPAGLFESILLPSARKRDRRLGEEVLGANFLTWKVAVLDGRLLFIGPSMEMFVITKEFFLAMLGLARKKLIHRERIHLKLTNRFSGKETEFSFAETELRKHFPEFTRAE